MNLLARSLGLSSILLAGAACVAQQPAKQPAEPFVVAAGPVALDALIDRAAAYLGCNILFHPRELQSQLDAGLRLQRDVATDRDGCEELLANLLHSAGFALTQVDATGALREVVARNGARAREVQARAVARTPEQILARPKLRVPVSTVAILEHLASDRAQNALRQVMQPSGGPIPELTIGSVGGGVLLTGMQDQVAQALLLLKASDLPSKPEARGGQERFAELERRLQALEAALAALRQPGASNPAKPSRDGDGK
jgi:hypothetical protein